MMIKTILRATALIPLIFLLPATFATAKSETASAASAKGEAIHLALNLSTQRQFSVPAGDLTTALIEFSKQAQLQIMSQGSSIAQTKTPGVTGNYTIENALKTLLQNTNLQYTATGENTIAITVKTPLALNTGDKENTGNTGEGALRVAQNTGTEGAPNTGSETVQNETNENSTDSDSDRNRESSSGIPEILVLGAKSQNVDIRRTENDLQPYVVLTREDIRKSNATTIDDFLRSRLPMNTARAGANQPNVGAGEFGAAGGGLIDLRGLGTSQTLILVDGRRLPSVGSFDLKQADINGIPLSAIERVEILPSTAGAIYGGSAVGGVVNIILRRDFNGIDIQLDYGNAFDGATGDFKASANGGFNLGSTGIMFTASRTRTDPLLVNERNDLVRHARELLLFTNPTAITLASPIIGRLPNICGSTATGTCNGSLLVLDNGTPLNASITTVPAGYPGPLAAGDAGAALIANAGRYNLDTPLTGDTFIRGARIDSAGLNIRQSIGSLFELFGDFFWDRNAASFGNTGIVSTVLAASNPNNPFQQPIRVAYTFPGVPLPGETEVTTRRLNGGAIMRLPNNWSLSLEQGWSRSHTTFQFSSTALLFPSGPTLAAPFGTRDTNQFPPDLTSVLAPRPNSRTGPATNTMLDSMLRLSGTVLPLSAGPVRLAMLAERRQEKIDDIEQLIFNGTVPGYVLNPSREQTVKSLYLEATAPLVSESNAVAFVRELQLQGSIRHDRYTSVSSNSAFSLPTPDAPHAAAVYVTGKLRSTDSLLALRYSPVRGVMLRGSYSTGFLPPALSQLGTFFTNNIQASSVASVTADPKRGGAALIGDPSGRLQTIGGGNADLEPERSKSGSAGIVLEPLLLAGLRISADYTRIRKTDEIQSPSLQMILDFEDLFPGRVVRDAPKLSTDPADWAAPVTSIDARPVNIGLSHIEAWDFQLDYRFELGKVGILQPYIIATRQTDLTRRVAPGYPATQYLGFTNGPLKWRGNFGFEWTWGLLSIGWNMQYYDGYNVCQTTNSPATCSTRTRNQGAARIAGQSYHDLSVRYVIDGRSDILSGVEIAAGVQNIFDKQPPAIAIAGLFGNYSTFGDPRLRRYTLTLVKRFSTH